MIDWGFLGLRIALGSIFMMHGAQKLFGAFGGHGLSVTMEKMGTPLGLLVTIGEFFGGLGILLGILPRFSAASIIVIMVGAIVKVHGKGGFFLPAGFEYCLALIGMAFPIMLAGPGKYSISELVPWSRLISRDKN